MTRFVAQPVRTSWSGAAVLGVVGLIAVLVPAAPLAVDARWSEAMWDIQTPFLKHLALVFDALGHGIARALTLAAVGIVLLVGRRWLALACFALVESLAPLASTILKAAVGRPRPPEAMVHPSGSSFPSGHATYAGATCVALVLLFTTARSRRGRWWALAAAGIVGMAWSRTYLQVHWLSDVVAGSLLGIGTALLVFGGATSLVARAWPGTLPTTVDEHDVLPIGHDPSFAVRAAARARHLPWCRPWSRPEAGRASPARRRKRSR